MLTVTEIANLPVPSILARDAICALWATTPLGSDPYKVLTAWGFTYKTKLYWHKVGRKGIGYWLRGEIEELLIGIKGDVRAWRSSEANWLEVPEILCVGESKPEGHSRKPREVRDLLTHLTPGAARVELFATETVPGWDSYGLALDPSHNFLDPAFWEQFHGRDAEGSSAPVPPDDPAPAAPSAAGE